MSDSEFTAETKIDSQRNLRSRSSLIFRKSFFLLNLVSSLGVSFVVLKVLDPQIFTRPEVPQDAGEWLAYLQAANHRPEHWLLIYLGLMACCVGFMLTYLVADLRRLRNRPVEGSLLEIGTTSSFLTAAGYMVFSHRGFLNPPLMNASIDYPNNIIAPLIVAAISAIGAWIIRGRREEKRLVDALTLFVDELGRQIFRAHDEGPENAVVNARVIVKTAGGLRETLGNLSKNLNSEIDVLAGQIGSPLAKLEKQTLQSNEPRNDRTVDKHAVFETIRVLHLSWPSKKTQIEIELRRLFAALGIRINGL